MNTLKVFNHFLLKVRSRIHNSVADLLWCQRASEIEKHVSMYSQSALLFKWCIICCSITIDARMIFTNSKNMLDKHFTLEMKETCTSNWIVCYKFVALIRFSEGRLKCLLGICKI